MIPLLKRFSFRLGISLVLLFGVSLLSFSLIHFAPGDPVTALLGNQYSPEEAESLREELGLDASVVTQYKNWLTQALHGDFGRSIITREEVSQLIGERLQITLQISLFAFVIALLLGLPLGVTAARSQSRCKRLGLLSFGFLGLSTPSFWMGSLLILLFSAKLGWLPSSGYYGFSYLILPSVSMGLVVAGVLLKMTEKLVREEQKKDYVRTLRAKGLSETVVFYKHILRNALIPILTVAGMQLGYLLSGTVVIETLFAIPGLGDLALSSIRSRDLPVLQAVILISALFFILLNQLVDLLYSVVDPRVAKK